MILQKLINFLKDLFNKEKVLQSKEEYYNTKYPFVDITYTRVDKIGKNRIDVRQFLNSNNFMLPIIEGKTDDEIAVNSLLWVIKNIKYMPDSNQYKDNEYWAFGYETLNSKKGDCEDGAILLYNILRANKIPSWKIRVSAGFVKVGEKREGHAYVTYYCEESDKWVVLDWCYWPNTLNTKERKDYKEEKKYIDVWFSFNENYSWSKGLNAEAEKVLN